MANVNYRVKLYGRTGNYLADLSDELAGRGRSVILNNIDSVKFGLSTRATNADLVQPLSTFIRVWRDVEGRAPRPEAFPNFCGWVAQPTRNAKTKNMTFQAYSPLWRTQHRFHFDPHDFTDPAAEGAPVEALDNVTLTPSQIVWRMIGFTAEILSGTWGDDYMGMALGSLNTANEAIWYERYARGQNTWALIDNFLGKKIFDLHPTYIHDQYDPQVQMLFNTTSTRGLIRNSPKLEFISNTEDPRYPGNLDDVQEIIITDPKAVANYVVVQGPGDSKADRTIWIADGATRTYDWLGAPTLLPNGTWTRTGGPAVPTPDTLDKYGIYMDWQKDQLAMFQDQRDPTAYRKLVRSAEPPQVLTAIFPNGSDSGFEHDWGVGDGMLVSCDEGAMNFTDVRRRVARVDQTLDDLGAEQTIVTLVEDYTTEVTSV